MGVTCRLKITKIVQIRNQMAAKMASFPEPKGELTQNMVGSIVVMCS